jgi:succinate dehydrogenase/fumarate reductase flavoprotein subunit
MATALAASVEGLSVLVLEKTELVGGATATSAGTVWIPGNRASREAGHGDTAEAAALYLDGLIGAPDPHGLRAAFLATGPEAIDAFAAHSEVKFTPSGKHPDYRDAPGAAVHGRTLSTLPFDGRRLGKDFRRVRPPLPEFLVFGGLMVGKSDIPRLLNRFRNPRDFAFAAGLFLRYLADRIRHPRGARLLMGNALVARLLFSLRARGVPIRFSTVATELVFDAGRVVGVEASSEGGALRLGARCGVVVATGGYGRNEALRERFMRKPAPPLSVTAAANTGDGMELGLRHGALVQPEIHGPGAFWTPVSVTRRRGGEAGVFPHLFLDRAKPGLIAVNAAGERFVNEGCSYHDFVEAMFGPAGRGAAIPAHLICESAFVTRYGLGNIRPGARNLRRYEAEGYIVTAATLGDLARKVGVDPAALAETVARHNAFALNGKDLDFGKGDTELNRFNCDPLHRPNPCLAPIERGPFVALTVWPAELASSTGLQTDADGRVLDASERPIDGLYAAGTDMASIMLGAYPGPGTVLGPALTFAYRTARHAAAARSASPAPGSEGRRPGRGGPVRP